MINELVSIITPAYNSERTIAETIKSVLLQTYSNWEMIIVDDASTDNTLSVIESFCRNDSRIKVFSMDKNSGSAAAKNKAISFARGRYLAFLDSDDVWKCEKLKKQIAFMSENKYGFTFTAYEIFHQSNEINRKIFYVPEKIDYEHYLRNTIIGNLTVMIDRKIILGFYIESGYLEDVLTWMIFLKQGYTAYGLNENLASYRVYTTSKSGNKIRNAKRYFICLRKNQKLSLLKSLYCEFCYMYHAILKRIRKAKKL